MTDTGDTEISPGFVLAIDFGGTKVAVGTARADGELIGSERIETLAEQGAEQALERTLALAQRLCAHARAESGDDCLAVAAVSPGVVGENRVLLAPNVRGWERLALPAILGERLGADLVVVANDVNAAALAEARWGALRETRTGIFVSLGTGIKAGLLIGGRVFTGAHGAAGEIGYSLRDPADVTGYAAGHAPLEEFVGGRALGERAGALLGEDLSGADVFQHRGLPAGFLEEWLAVLTMHIANLAIAVDPERVALGGGLMAHADTILPAVSARMDAALPFPPEVVPARFLHDGALRGAVALALDAVARADRPRLTEPV